MLNGVYKIYRRNLVLVLLIFSCNLIFSQDFSNYIHKAWENNEQLKSKTFNLKVAESALKEAKALYGPTATFNTQYSLAAGGRSIALPVGDLMNPVYSTLNKLTNSNSFPQIENVEEQFLPNNFYDAKFRVGQPIYNPELALNKKLKKESIELKTLEIKAYKRWLSKEVIQAYLLASKANEANKIFQSSDSLLSEAKRTTQSMVKNGVALPSAINRIESQIATIDGMQIEAKANYENAKKYLFFLLGTQQDPGLEVVNLPELPSIEDISTAQREEIMQIEKAMDIQKIALEKEKQFYYPKLGAQLDFGSQAFKFGWSPYALLGINLEMNLYDNKRNQKRKEQAELNLQSTQAQLNYTKSQFDLVKNVSYENLSAAIQQAKTFQPRIFASKRLYQDVLKKYKEGTANYLELVDASTQITQTELQYSISKYAAWEKWAEYIYNSAQIKID